MRGALGIMAGVSAGLQALPVFACSPAALDPSGPVRGARCQVSQVVTAYEVVGFSEARDLGHGFVLQYTREGDACYSRASAVISDCTSGEVVVIGEAALDASPSEGEDALDRFTARVEKLARQRRLSLPAAADAGEREGMMKASYAQTRDRLRMMGKSFAIDCGCKTFYPQLKPGRAG